MVELSKTSKLILFIVLSLLGVLGQLFPVPLLFGIDIILGSVFVYLILALIGQRAAIIAALPIFSCTFLLWGHPYAGINQVFELAVVLYFYKRFGSRALPFIVGNYWLIVGAAFTIGTYHEFLGQALGDAVHIGVKQAVNGLLNAILATFIYFVISSYLSRRPNQKHLLSLAEMLFIIPAVLIAISTIILAVMTSRYQMTTAVDNFGQEIDVARSAIEERSSILKQQVSRQITRAVILCEQQNEQATEQTRNVNFCDDYVFEDSHISAIYLGSPAEGWQTLISEKPSLAQIQSQHYDALSSVLGTHLNKQDSSLQIVSRQDAFAAAFRWSASAQRWEVAVLEPRSFFNDLILRVFDPDLRIVWSFGERKIVSAVNGAFENTSVFATDNAPNESLQHWLPQTGYSNKVDQWAKSVYYKNFGWREIGLDLDGAVRLEISPRSVQKSIFAQYTQIFGWVFILLLAGIWVSWIAARRIQRPVGALVNYTEVIPHSLQQAESLPAHSEHYVVEEFFRLQQGLNTMQSALQRQFRQLKRSEHLLEAKVQARTQELEYAYEHINSMVNSINGGFWSLQRTDNGLKLLYMSPGIEQLTGYNADYWQQNFVDIIGKFEQQQHKALKDILFSDQKSGMFEADFDFAGTNERRRLAIYYWHVRSNSDSARRVDGLILDITDAYRDREKVKEQREALIKQSRQAAMGEVISNVAHQWRQPLNALRLTLVNTRDCIEYEDDCREEAMALLDKSDNIIGAMDNTIRDFLHHFKPDEPPQQFSILSCLKSVLDKLPPDYQRLTIDKQLYDDLMIVGYSSELEQAFMHIIRNVYEQMRQKDMPSAELSLRAEQIEGGLSITFEDNLAGVGDSELEKLTEPHYTNKADSAGMGLYFVKMLIEKQMNGQLSISNARNGLSVNLTIFSER